MVVVVVVEVVVVVAIAVVDGGQLHSVAGVHCIGLRLTLRYSSQAVSSVAHLSLLLGHPIAVCRYNVIRALYHTAEYILSSFQFFKVQLSLKDFYVKFYDKDTHKLPGESVQR